MRIPDSQSTDVPSDAERPTTGSRKHVRPDVVAKQTVAMASWLLNELQQ